MKPRPPKKSGNVARSAPPKPGPSANPWWAHAVVVLGLLLLNLGLYWGTTAVGFLSVDDPDYVQHNPYLESFSAANLKRIFAAPYEANYAPANILSYTLDVVLAGGKDAFAIHLSNVMWHGWVVCMVYWLAFTIRPAIFTAAAAAALFMLHPAHVEVVAWISSRKDLVATGFAALSMIFYLLCRRAKRRGWWYAGSLLWFLVASAGKQSVILLPAVMLAWDVLVEKRRNWTVLADKIPFGLITIFFGLMTWHAQPSTGRALHAFVLASTQFTNFWLLTGFGKYVLYRVAPDPAAWSQAARLAIIAAAVVVWALPLLLQKARQPVLAALCYWVLIQMVPPMVLSFMVPITDRYLFLPSVGVCILLADVAAALAGKLARGHWIGIALLAGLGAVWGAKTWNYVNEWRDPRSVWYGAHLKTKSPQVFQFLGEVYQNAGDRIDNFVKSHAPLQVTNELRMAQAFLGDAARVDRLRAEWLGTAPARTNSIAYRDVLWDFAWEKYGEAVTRRGTLSAPNLFLFRGRLLVSRGKFEQAIPEFQTALSFARTSNYEIIRQKSVTHALRSIGVAYWSLRNYKEAKEWFLKAQETQRKSGQVWISTLDQEVERITAMAGGQP
jgi:hypothetical protein